MFSDIIYIYGINKRRRHKRSYSLYLMIYDVFGNIISFSITWAHRPLLSALASCRMRPRLTNVFLLENTNNAKINNALEINERVFPSKLGQLLLLYERLNEFFGNRLNMRWKEYVCFLITQGIIEILLIWSGVSIERRKTNSFLWSVAIGSNLQCCSTNPFIPGMVRAKGRSGSKTISGGFIVTLGCAPPWILNRGGLQIRAERVVFNGT